MTAMPDPSLDAVIVGPDLPVSTCCTACGSKAFRFGWSRPGMMSAGHGPGTAIQARVAIWKACNISLREKWAEGPRNYLGLMVHGFPNLFTVTGPGSPSVLSNVVHSIEQHVDWLADCIACLRANELDRIEAAEIYIAFDAAGQAGADFSAIIKAIPTRSNHPAVGD